MGCKQHRGGPPTFSTFFRKDMVMKIFLRPFFLKQQKTDFKIWHGISEGIFGRWGTEEIKIKEELSEIISSETCIATLRIYKGQHIMSQYMALL